MARQIVVTPSLSRRRPGAGQARPEPLRGFGAAPDWQPRGRPQTPWEYLGTPIHFFAEVIGVTANSAAAVNTLALQHPEGRPFEIHAMKFMVESGIDPATGNVGMVNGGLGAISLEMGGIALTHGFVPLWSFGRCDGLYEDLHRYPASNGTAPRTTNPVSAKATYVWRLPRPLYVPPEMMITPTFQHRGVMTAPFDFAISFVGRTVEEKQRGTIEVPYAASWLSASYGLNDARSVDRSTETDLRNPFNQPMHVSHITCRAFNFQSAASGGGFALIALGNPAKLASDLLTMKMTHSSGHRVVEEWTPVSQVFNMQCNGATWVCPHDLGPEEFYIVELLRTVNPVGTFTDPTGYQDFQAQMQFGLIGWREVVL